MMPLRRAKLVSVCSVEHAHVSGDSLQYFNNKLPSSTTKMTVSVRTPINQINLLMMEMFPDSKTSEMDASVQCNKLNIMTLCCGANANAEDIRYNFEKEYQAVEQITLSGHIGSIRLAFDLLKYFKKCREFIFVVNDYNARFPYGRGDTLVGMRQYVDVQSVKIIHDFTIVDKKTLDIQSSTWRLDEFLEGCKECFPNLKKFEVSIHGTGANFDKINRFILGHPHLNNHYSVEINNEKVRTKPKPVKALPSSSVHKALLPPPAAATHFGSQGRPIPVDRNALQYIPAAQEQRPQDLQMAVAVRNIKQEPQSDEDGENEIARNGKNVGSFSSGNSGVNHYSHLSQDNVQQYSLPVAPSYSAPDYRCITYPQMKAIDWKEDPSINYCQLSRQGSELRQTLLSASTGGRKDNGMFQTLTNPQPQSITSDSAFSEVTEEDDEDSRFRAARNPSPPPGSQPSPVVNARSFLGNAKPNPSQVAEKKQETNFNNEPQRAPGAPPPPIISKNHPDNKKLVTYSEDGERSSSQSSDDDGRVNGRKVGPRDPRPRRQSSSSPRSPRSPYRSRSRSGTPSKRSRSRSSSPSPRRRRSRYRSPESCRLAPREGHSRRRSRHSDSRRRSMSRSRSRSRSYSPPYGGYRGGRGTRGYSRGYNPALRRGRGRGVRGFRSRGGRARGFNNTVRGRGQTTNYNNYFSDPRQPKEGENWETAGE